MLIRRIFKIESKLLLTLLAIIVAIAPQFTETYFYLYCADSYLLAFFAAALAVFSLTKIDKIKNSKRWVILTIISTILTCSLYQAYLGVLLGLLVAYAVKETLDKSAKIAIKNFVRNCAVILIGVCIYYVMFLDFCFINHVRPSGYKGANKLGLSTLLAMPENIANAFSDFYRFFFVDRKIINNDFYNRGIFYMILLVVFAFASFKIFKNEKSKKSQILTTFLLLTIFPIAVNIMDIIASGTRINLVTGPGILITAVLFIIMIDRLKDCNFNNLLRYVSSIVLIILAWTFTLSNIHTYVARNGQYDAFKNIAQNIYNKATALENYKPNMKFMFSNVIQTPAKEFEKTNGMITGNTLSWTGYAGVRRYTYFFNKYLGLNISSADADEYLKIVETDEFKNMEIYPENESVKIIDGVVVIKTSEKVLVRDDGTIKNY